MKKHLPAWGLVAACAACCAPLLLAAASGLGLGAATAGAGWSLGLSAEALICAAIGTAALAAMTVWLLRRRAQQRAAACQCTTACNAEHCATTTGATQ